MKKNTAKTREKATVVGIDLAKNVFHLVGMNAQGKVVWKERVYRVELAEFVVNLPQTVLVMEACASSHYWGRKFQSFGHEVKLIAPQYVKPYVKTNKNDMADAEAIAEAATRPTMRFVPLKSQEQQDIQTLHRIRERYVTSRTALANQTRGISGEYGIVFSKSVSKLCATFHETMEKHQDELSADVKEMLYRQYDEIAELSEHIKKCEDKLKEMTKNNYLVQLLLTIPGIGLMTATALYAAVGNCSEFKNGRHLAAWLGLVPRQHSSGGKNVLLGISKRGDVYLRKLLIHGARSVLQHATKKTDRRSCWALALKDRAGTNRTAVALANKNARTVWAVLTRKEPYQALLAA